MGLSFFNRKEPLVIRKVKYVALRDLLLGLSITGLFVMVDLLSNYKLSHLAHTLIHSDSDSHIEQLVAISVWLLLCTLLYTFRRFSDIKTLNRAVTTGSYRDSLTLLPNRLYAFEYLNELIRHSDEGGIICIGFVDFDNFKTLNDNYGHEFGDEVLRQVAYRLQDLVREDDVVARLGGDEFLLIARFDSHDDINKWASEVESLKMTPFRLRDKTLSLRFSIGISCYPEHGVNASSLISNADIAMYHSKQEGLGIPYLFTHQMGEKLRVTQSNMVKLLQAIEKDQLHLVYQPIFRKEDGQLIGLEALLRWSEMSTEKLITFADDQGVGFELTTWVVNTACREMKALLTPDIKLTLNVTPSQILNPNFLAKLRTALDANQLDANMLELDLTHSDKIDDLDALTCRLTELKEMGVQLALDDFGYGYSSFVNLKSLCFDYIKIDRLFTSNKNINQKQDTLESMVNLATSLNMLTVVEGVETQEQASFVSSLNCTAWQGNYFSQPCSIEQIPHIIKKFNAVPLLNS